MRTTKVEERLRAGEAVTGLFSPAGTDFEAAGVLMWTDEDGVLLELIDREHPWPNGADASFTVHGTPYDGERITLMDCMARRWSLVDVVTHISSAAVAVGEHTTPDEMWPKSNYRPGALHEWIPETGISFDSREPDGSSFVLTYQRPERRAVDLADGGEVAIYPSGEYAWSYAPSWQIETGMTFGCSPPSPLTVKDHRTSYGDPLRGFCIFAADKPDDFLVESYYNPATGRRIAVFRPNRHPSTSPWRPRNDRFLFQAEHVPDVPETLRRWLGLWHASAPALGLYAETIEQGSSYSAPRFLTLYTAAETYYKAIHSAAGPWSPRALAAVHDIDQALTGASKDAVARIGKLRNYHAHGSGKPFEDGDEEAIKTFEATRVLQAIMQVCVMSDLGLPGDVVEKRMKAHYRAWPLPENG